MICLIDLDEDLDTAVRTLKEVAQDAEAQVTWPALTHGHQNMLQNHLL